MSFKKWIIGSPDREFAKEAAEELDIDPFTALVANSRGINDFSEFEYFLSEEPLLSSPKTMKDITKAADCINEAIGQNLKIAVFGDYDCDGVMATAIMYKYLLSRNADVITYIPDRIDEGYGMNNSAIDFLNSKDVKMIITVDNGIACIKEIEYAASLGIVTVVTDHHLPGTALPDACAVVDPHREDCSYPFKEICGAQVAFNLVCVIDEKEPEEMLPLFADLLSVAIIGDYMPMIGENRSIVKYGIKAIKQNSNIGLSTVLSVSGIDRASLDSSKLSFGIVPRINAAGRMGCADRALKLVTEKNIGAVLSLANEIESDNASRQKTEKDIFCDVCFNIETNGYDHDRVVVVSGNGYHQGVIGIVAAKVCEKFGRPAIVLSSDGEIAHGSGRSIKGFNIFDAIGYCSACLEKFGGHELAAGVSVKECNIDAFRKKINEYARSIPPVVPTLSLDFKINPTALSLEMVDAIRILEPFGNGNPTPVFGVFSVQISKITPIGQGKHLKLFFSKNETSFKTLLFGTSAGDFPFNVGDTVDIAIILDKNTYKNDTSLSVIIKAIRPSDFNDEQVFSQYFAIDDFLSNKKIDRDVLLPSREEIGAVYRFVMKNNVSFEKLIYAFLSKIGYAKTYISITVLKELKLIDEENGVLFVLSSSKTDLINSNTYKLIFEAGDER